MRGQSQRDWTTTPRFNQPYRLRLLCPGDTIYLTLKMISPALDELPYTVQNLPYGVISTSSETKPRCAVAIGQHAVDLAKYSKNGNLFDIESGHNFMFQQMFSEVCSLRRGSLQERTAC